MDDGAPGVEDGYGDDMYRGEAEFGMGQVRERKIGFSYRVVRDGDDLTESEVKTDIGGDTGGTDDVADPPSAPLKKEYSEEDRRLLKSLHSSSLTLLENLRTLVDHQSYMRQREAAHRDLAELTNSRIQFYSFVELVALVLVSGAQIMFLQRFFEKKRRF